MSSLDPCPFSGCLKGPRHKNIVLSPLCMSIAKEDVQTLKRKKGECLEPYNMYYGCDSVASKRDEVLKSISSTGSNLSSEEPSMYFLSCPHHDLTSKNATSSCVSLTSTTPLDNSPHHSVTSTKDESKSTIEKDTSLEEGKRECKDRCFPCCEEFYIGEDEVLAARGEMLPEELEYVQKIKEMYGMLDKSSQNEKPACLPHSCSDPSAYRNRNDHLRRLHANNQQHPPSMAYCGKYFKKSMPAKYSSSNDSSHRNLSGIPEEKGEDFYENFTVSSSRAAPTGKLLSPTSDVLSLDSRTTESSKNYGSDSEYYSCQASQFKLFDKKLREMLYSFNRTSRRAAIQKILKDRGLECVPQSMSYPKNHYNEDVKTRKSKILAKVKKIVSADGRLGNHCAESEESQSDEEVLCCLSGLSRRPSVSTASKTLPEKQSIIKKNTKPIILPDIIVTPPSPPPSSENTSPSPKVENDSTPVSARSAIAKAYMAYQKVVSKATPLMKSTIISNKWEVISYLSGLSSTSQFFTETPEWYTAIHSLLSQAEQVEGGSDGECAGANANFSPDNMPEPLELSYLC